NKGRGMRKSIMDVAGSQFISLTISKAEEDGRSVILVNPRDTSKMCSQCGELVEKKLSERTHTCHHCEPVMDRDKNAALNILQRGRKTLRLEQTSVGRHALKPRCLGPGSRHNLSAQRMLGPLPLDKRPGCPYTTENLVQFQVTYSAFRPCSTAYGCARFNL